MLDSAIKDQLKGLFAQLEAHYTFDSKLKSLFF